MCRLSYVRSCLIRQVQTYLIWEVGTCLIRQLCVETCADVSRLVLPLRVRESPIRTNIRLSECGR